ncbi:MAG: sigma 54-interacting transcriptional regulator [Hyphomicrobiaceae bacterium]|nr:sigma 54-interacting transcriptional regulator [Hyphomicrobiaceae bacterium]
MSKLDRLIVPEPSDDAVVDQTAAALPQLLELAFEGAPTPQLVISPFDNALIAANAAARALFGDRLESGLPTGAAALFGASLGSLHVATQAAMYKGRAWTRDLVPSVATQPVAGYECCLVGLARANHHYVHITMFDLDARGRRTIDDEAEALHRAGLAEWRRAERFFRELEERHRLILSAAGEGIYGVDAEGITTFVNPAAERMLGWKAEDLIGREMHAAVHHKHADGKYYPAQDCPIYNAFRLNTVTVVDDEVFWHKDGKPVRVEYTSTPLIEDGEPVGAVIVFRDISERKQSEETLRRALEENAALRERLEKENAYLQEEILTHSNHHEILGRSEGTQRILRQIEVVAATNANVLIVGESGTGKELVASAIHQASQRKDRPLIRVNCAAVPRELFESEFFGHVRGAFSGAIRDRIGRFELADGGTLFLDEVGEIPTDLQSKLLRVLQEGRFERVGEAKTRKVDVRIIAATNRNLKIEVGQGRFREDLFFRLNVFPIECAPLRQRKVDIPLLAQHFLKLSCRRINAPVPSLTHAHVEMLQSYGWPGNARELQNVMERAAILARDGRLVLNLPGESEKPSPSKADSTVPHSGETRVLTAAQMAQLEERNLLAAVAQCNGRISGKAGAAELLDMNPQTLYSRLRKLRHPASGTSDDWSIEDLIKK